MALKITRSVDPIEIKTIIMELHTPPGIGKTSTGFTASKPMLLAFDKGVYRSKNRKDCSRIERWEDVTAITDEDMEPYDTIVVDTVGIALELLSISLIKSDARNARKDGALSIQGYGALASVFQTWLTRIRSLGKDIVLLSHMTEEKKGDDLIERLDIQGKTKNEIYKVSDAMGRIYLENGKRWLSFDPSETSFGKNPGGFPPVEVPDYTKEPLFLAGIIQRTKDALNELSEEQREVATLLEGWSAKLAAAKTPEDFDKLRAEGRESDPRVRPALPGLMSKEAKAKGVVFDKGADKFMLAAKPEEKTEAPKSHAGGAETRAPSQADPSAAPATPDGPDTTGPAGSANGPAAGDTRPTARGGKKAQPKQQELGAERVPGEEG